MKKILPLFSFGLGLVLIGSGCATATITTTGGSALDLAPGVWTEGEVDQGSIPSDPMMGTINGEDVEIAHVQIDFDGEEYRWTFSDTDNEFKCSFESDDSEVNFRSKDLTVGTFYKTADDDVEFDDYHSYYKYEQEDGTPFSVNTDWDATIVVETIERNLEEGTFGEQIGMVTGYADIGFTDGKTRVMGMFEAELCEDIF